MHDGRSDLVDVVLFFLGEAQHIEGLLLLKEASLKSLFYRHSHVRDHLKLHEKLIRKRCSKLLESTLFNFS